MSIHYMKMAFERISRMFKEIRMPPLTGHSLQDATFLGTDRGEVCEDFTIKGGNA